MLVSVARTLSLDDPRVGAAWAPDTPPAGPEAKGPLCPAPASSGSLEGFPYGSSLGVQVRKRNTWHLACCVAFHVRYLYHGACLLIGLVVYRGTLLVGMLLD